MPIRLGALCGLLRLAAVVAAASLLPAPAASAACGSCATTLARMFHHRGYLPDYLYPFGEDLRLTIYSAAERQSPAAPDPNRPDEPRALDTVGDMFAALRGCWMPPDGDGIRPGMEMTVRFALKRDGEMIAPPRITYATRGAAPETRDVYFKAIMAALQRCTPLSLSEALASEIVGIPIAVRFVDDRQMRG